MNLLTIETLDGAELILNIPANLNELTFGQLIDLQNPELTIFESLSILSGIPVDDLYNVRSYQEVTKIAKLYIDLFKYNLQAAELNKIPRKISVNYKGRRKTIKIKNPSMEPAGAYMVATKIISSEIYAHIDLYGEDNWKINFNPSLESCIGIVNAFLYCRVTGVKWTDDNGIDLSRTMSAADVLSLAKHFYNVWPNLCNRRKPKGRFAHIVDAVFARFKTLFSAKSISYSSDGIMHAN
jgi:hypothetical protein